MVAFCLPSRITGHSQRRYRTETVTNSARHGTHGTFRWIDAIMSIAAWHACMRVWQVGNKHAKMPCSSMTWGVDNINCWLSSVWIDCCDSWMASCLQELLFAEESLWFIVPDSSVNPLKDGLTVHPGVRWFFCFEMLFPVSFLNFSPS